LVVVQIKGDYIWPIRLIRLPRTGSKRKKSTWTVLRDSSMKQTSVYYYRRLSMASCRARDSFFKKLVECLKKIGFQGGYADPCLMTRRCEKGIVYIALYVDGCYCVGHKEAIQDTITKIIANGFDVKVKDDLTDYLSCNILFNKNKTKAWLGQPHLIKNLEKKYGEAIKSLQAYKTPGTPGQGIVRPDKGETSFLASPEDQTLYRSGVGMLLYLVKHSRPDIANVVRELSKVMDGATPAAIKEMKRVIKFVLDRRHYCLDVTYRITKIL
jgi:hypothetical protein